ncbi:hypothetical protein SETIT_2G092800v2 [Setaria italica]|uniref:Uncharacterized protein n=1 Tax=Setaria italica TaxID=4555 RepID=A0A368PWU7_SETIT|nr:hypothetical protein SETIT_2G092800v2 [Setaria italica]
MRIALVERTVCIVVGRCVSPAACLVFRAGGGRDDVPGVPGQEASRRPCAGGDLVTGAMEWSCLQRASKSTCSRCIHSSGVRGRPWVVLAVGLQWSWCVGRLWWTATVRAELPGESFTRYMLVSVTVVLSGIIFLLEGISMVLLDLPVKTLFRLVGF